jgi:hypothetical protein
MMPEVLVARTVINSCNRFLIDAKNQTTRQQPAAAARQEITPEVFTRGATAILDVAARNARVQQSFESHHEPEDVDLSLKCQKCGDGLANHDVYDGAGQNLMVNTVIKEGKECKRRPRKCKLSELEELDQRAEVQWCQFCSTYSALSCLNTTTKYGATEYTGCSACSQKALAFEMGFF